MKRLTLWSLLGLAIVASAVFVSCSKGGGKASVGAADAASAVYVAPGEKDEFYNFVSGGFSGQLAVYGLPSGRLFRVIPVFSVDPEKSWGFSEETKPMLMTSHGFIPWDDAHHPDMSQTDGVPDGKYVFINGNNTPRIARIDLKDFRTKEIIELPNSAGNHSSPFSTQNSEYVIAGTRFSVPIPNEDVSIDTYKEKFKGALSFIKMDKNSGAFNLAWQILMPGFDYDLARCGKGPSGDWMFYTCYNSEKANTMKEINASQNDKDFIVAVNWKKIEAFVAQGKGQIITSRYAHNVYNDETHSATSTIKTSVRVVTPADVPGCIYYIPTPKSPHGCDVDPSGEYIVGGGKLATVIPVMSFSKMIKAIESKAFDGEIDGISVLKYDACLAGEVKNPGLGPLHTEFDDKGNAYTSMFVSSEITKWSLKDFKVIDKVPTYYSIGHLCIPGGNSKKPWGKYVIAYNKITKDRYLPTGPELTQSAQLYDISGEKMKLLLDFPTIGEPHYAQAVPADLIAPNSTKIYKIENNKHPYVTRKEADARVERKGNEVHIYMTSIRSHFAPDNIEGVKVGDKVYWHVTNLEQDWDVPHGFAVLGNNNAELLIMPGETSTATWEPKYAGVYAFYCTDFCSALHQEMQGYVRVSGAGSSTPITWNNKK
ncbi:MAG: Sec-dependent nitrous-oxide reductase [Ignavibacteriae bacterium]|nr:MAG: Sec-dependent nitrous-oxide reductase [Ignavibacteriota bacterium]